MYTITVDKQRYELSTTLKVAARIENEFSTALPQLFEKLAVAETPELVKILDLAIMGGGEKPGDAIMEHWDYTDLLDAVQRLIVRILYSGSPVQVEKKLSQTKGGDEEEKNEIRALLGLPVKQISTTRTNGGNG